MYGLRSMFRANGVGAAVLGFAACFTTGGASAREIYCRFDQGLSVHDGGEYSRNWTVVTSGVRTVQLAGKDKPTKGCSSNWRSLGGFYRPIEIVKGPSLGGARVGPRYRVFYASTRTGNDELAFKVHWLSRTGEKQSALVKYNISVVDKPM